MSCTNPIVVEQGESKTIEFDLTDTEGQKVTDLTDWTCKIQLRRNDSAKKLIFEKDVTDKNEAGDEFVVMLLEEDTDIGVSKEYRLGILFNNATTGQNDKDSRDFEITETWVFNDA
ncbi:MAG: hypothetical protein Unbinned3818contig1000_36 [Prokaryotic dsDNA virus sp.]|nr:hypothetical protein [Phycisphaerae bacterium]QDP45965.1 MAG: hypothetical protein Unbinned3818contig1000_36 [Prokaryotic dsDNA virus sp.]|tara:strand:+ start:16343 stop:16690 length:348 start_codon:yes stop_codon:yes gene_type:complete